MHFKILRFGIRELSAVVILAVFSGIIAANLQDFVLVKNGEFRTGPIIISFFPVVFFYILARQILRPLSGLIFTTLSFYLLAEANRVKQALTGEPLVWTDISTTSNFSVIWHYISIEHAILLPLFLGIAALIIKFNQFRIPKGKDLVLSLILLIFLFPIVFYPYTGKINEYLEHKIQSRLSDLGVRYSSWDWVHNLKLSGLPLHLIQTSRREIPATPNKTEVSHFSSLKGRNAQIEDPPRNVIFILCEACWHNDTHFQKEFDPLNQFSFTKFRAISPTYGGGTVNSAFELLTGLPAHAALTGVIYQEYATIMREDATTFPRAMKSRGYETVAAHNHYRKFWKRDIVKPKLGFDRFISLEDMLYTGPIWADDEVLFSKVLEEMQRAKKPGFYFLTTVYNHGGYRFDNDYGERDYSTRLGKSISRIAEFVDKALKIEPNSAILIVGDHKPALTKFFFEKGILPGVLFSKTGDRNEDFRFNPKPPRQIIGDVPAFFYHPNKIKALEFASNADLKPFYCLSNLFDQIYVGVDLPAFAFAREIDACSKFGERDYYKAAKMFPDYIFSLSLIQ